MNAEPNTIMFTLIIFIALDLLTTTIQIHKLSETSNTPYEYERNPIGRYLMKHLTPTLWIPIMFTISFTMYYILVHYIYSIDPLNMKFYYGVFIGVYIFLLYVHTMQIIDMYRGIA